MEIGLRIIYELEEILNIILISISIFNMTVKREKWRWITTFTYVVVQEIVLLITGAQIEGLTKDFIYIALISVLLIREKLWKKILLEMDSVILSSLCLLIPIYIQVVATDTPNWELDEAQKVLANTIVLALCVYLYEVDKKKKIAVSFTGKQCLIVSIGLWAVIFVIAVFQALENMGLLMIRAAAVLIFMTAVIGISFMILSLWLINSTKKNIRYEYEKMLMEKYFKSQEAYIDIIMRKNEDIRRFRHDIKGHMAALGVLIEQGRLEEANRYISQMIGILDMDRVKVYTGIAVVDAVICESTEKLSEKNIGFVWEGRINGCEKKVEVFDLCTIFMNLIKNAVEACERVEEEKSIEVKVMYINNEINISIRNTMNGEVEYKDGVFITTKEDKKNHGFGMLNIKDAVEKYGGIYKNKIAEGVFETIIVI